VDRSDRDGCWVWTRCKLRKYGRFGLRGRIVAAHRLAYAMANNVALVSLGPHICHHCDNPSCVNPAHLYEGDAQTNSDDKMRRGRAVVMRGEQHGRSKLVEGQVLAIRKDERLNRVLAQEYGVSCTLISMIKRRKIWRHL